jgi:DNA-binding winged helix-turn-helix (wHTH) protein/TolB-like protein/Tfp pilus assembly protein PilF
MHPPNTGRIYEFGEYRLDAAAQVLASKGDGRPIPLTPRVYDTLLFLVEHPNELLDKRLLMSAVWPNLVVEENNLDQNISTLRQALGERRGENRYIATVRGRGYRFVAPVSHAQAHAIGAEAAPATARPHAADETEATIPARTHSRARTYSAIALLLGLAIATAAWVLRPREPVAVHAATPRLAVLPFRPLAAADRSESLELGMTETLIAGLNGEGLAVQPLSAVRRFGGAEQDALLAGRELGVSAVLEGYIQRDGERLRVSARLLDVANGRQLWSNSFDEPFTDIFSVQDTIAGRVRAALIPELGGKAPALTRYTEDAEAYQLYVNGRFHRERGNEAGLRRALDDFEQAIARDPKFAAAYVGLAETYSSLAVFGIDAPNDVFPRAQLAVAKALELAPDLGAAHASRGHIKMVYEHDWAGADAELRRAIELDPGYASAHQFLGLLLAISGRFDEGLEHMRRAASLEPSRPMLSALIGMVLVYERHYDEAITQLQKTLEMDSALPTAHTYLAFAYLRRGDFDEAAKHLARVPTPTPGSFGYQGQIYALSGRRVEALAEIQRLIALSRQRYVPAYDIATIYAALGETDQTFAWLERAFADRSTLITWLPWDAVFDGIRSDPRYAAMTAKLNVGPRTAAR